MSMQSDPWAEWDDFWAAPPWFEGTWGGAAIVVGVGQDSPESAEPAEDMAPKHFIGFVVLDGGGDPYPGLAYALSGPDGDREEGELATDGQVRRDDVLHDGYLFQLKTVLEVGWDVEASDCGEEIGLTATVSGFEDGTPAEIRIFRERRETDDDMLESLESTVEGGTVRATWVYDPNADYAISSPPAELSFIAEVRVDGMWAKTLVPVRVTMPRVETAKWSRRATKPGKTVMMRVDLTGVPDDSPVTVEVFRQLRSGGQELLTTLEGIVVDDNGVEVPWVYECDPDDVSATEAECLFVVTSEVYLDVTKTSGPLWVSSEVGRRRKRRRRRR